MALVLTEDNNTKVAKIHSLYLEYNNTKTKTWQYLVQNRISFSVAAFAAKSSKGALDRSELFSKRVSVWQ